MKQTLIAALVLIAALTANAQLTARQAFISAPQSILPELTANARLDMLDYFTSNLTTPTDNLIGGKSRVLSLNDRQIGIKVSNASVVEIVMLPSDKDTLVAVITTVFTPQPDSRLQVFTSDWSTDVTDKVFTAPQPRQWLKKTADKKDIKLLESKVPFMLTDYSFSEAVPYYLIITNKTIDILDPDDAETLRPILRNSLLYYFDGKKIKYVKNQ